MLSVELGFHLPDENDIFAKGDIEPGVIGRNNRLPAEERKCGQSIRFLTRKFVSGQRRRDKHIKGGRCHYASQREYSKFPPRRVLLTTCKGFFRIDPHEERIIDPSTLNFDFVANLKGMNDVEWDSLKNLNANLPPPTLGLIMPRFE
ncbi:hypothetical protein KKE03_03715 [Patescibacteria group bacterium]|nr:hypothetical protein [Patescibacteria group bacterium]